MRWWTWNNRLIFVSLISELTKAKQNETFWGHKFTSIENKHEKEANFFPPFDFFREIKQNVRFFQAGWVLKYSKKSKSSSMTFHIYLFFLECRRIDGLCWYQKVDFNLSRQNHISLKKENSKKKALLIRGNGYLNHSAADFHQWKM